MSKGIVQFRYFGELNEKNYPTTISKAKLMSGVIFDDYTPIIKLGIQSLPGTKFRLNANQDYIMIGGVGLYELDMTQGTGVVTSINFDEMSLTNIDENQDAYLNEKINLKSVPVYYLEPNTIITVDDNKSDIHGEYILNKITIQLNHNGMMTVVATKAPPRLL